jgi:adenylate cyclase
MALTLAAALHTIGLWPSDAIERQDTIIADLRMRLAPPQLDPRIVIVDIDSRSLAEIGRFPWSRNILARLVRQLTSHYRAGAVGFDISFPEPDTPGRGRAERHPGAAARARRAQAGARL